jgi:hypothetical protein
LSAAAFDKAHWMAKPVQIYDPAGSVCPRSKKTIIAWIPPAALEPGQGWPAPIIRYAVKFFMAGFVGWFHDAYYTTGLIEVPAWLAVLRPLQG